MAIGYQKGYVIGKAEAYDDYVAPLPPGSGNRFVDSGTVRALTEIRAVIQSEPVSGVASARAEVFSTNIFGGLDAGTVTSSAVISGQDNRVRTSSPVVTGVSVPSHEEYFVPISTFRVIGIAEISGSNVFDDVERGTVYGTGRPSAISYAYYEDQFIILSSANIHDSLNSFHSSDSDTVTGEGSASALDFQHSTINVNSLGLSVISSLDDANFLDAGTVISEGVPLREIFDEATITSIAAILAIDGYSYHDSATVIAVSQASGETSTKLDSGIVNGIAVAIAIDSYGHSQSGIATGVGIPSAAIILERSRSGAGESAREVDSTSTHDTVDAGTVISAAFADAPNYGGYDFGSTYDGTTDYDDVVVLGEEFTDV